MPRQGADHTSTSLLCRGSGLGVSLCILLLLLNPLLPGCIRGGPSCQYGAITLGYSYSTTCTGIATRKDGTWLWKLAAEARTQRQTEEALATQLRAQALYAEELVMRWNTESCPRPQDGQERLPTGIERLVLAPASTSSVSVLLVCRPRAQDGLKRDMILTCRRGASTSIACTISLTYMPN